MRRRSFVLGVLMVILGFASQAQIYEVYRQEFEPGETSNYTVTSGSAAPQNSLFVGGERALKISHTSDMAVITLDTIDMTSYSDLSYYTLEFAHINNVSPVNCASTEKVAMIEVKLTSSDNWTRLTNTYYDKTSGSFSAYFEGSGYFCSEAYTEWMTGTPNQGWWKNERFNLGRLFANVNPSMRKLQVRFTLYGKANSVVSGDQAWWLDDIVVRASPQPMVKPIIKMLQYPDLVDYPSSRGANIKIAVQPGTATLAINPDSVYVEYMIGSNPTVHKHTMNAIVGGDNQYRYRIPFAGYDTMMYFRITAKDASTNQNTATVPTSSSAWLKYRCIRGAGNTAYMVEPSPSSASLTDFPFPSNAIAKSEYVIDSAILANAGFKPGAITGLDFIIKSGLQNTAQVRQNVQIAMRNVNTNFKTSLDMNFTNDYIQSVYRGNLNFPIVVNNNPFHVDLQDTFYYAGRDLIVQVIQDNDVDMDGAIAVAGVAAVNNKYTLWSSDLSYMDFDPYTSPEYKVAVEMNDKRPILGFTMLPNPSLLFDGGVSAIIHPASDNAAQAGMNETVQVTFKNMGVQTITAAQLTYQLDDDDPITYNWTGSLASGATTTVTLTTTQQFSVGYHTMKAWVEDTLTSNGQRYRDHEPYNDTSWVEFIACDGAMSGVRQIGGTNADFDEVDEFLFALSSCGIDGPLTVKLASGTYPAMAIPSFNGGSVANFIQFEPLEADGEVIFMDESTTSDVLVDMQAASYVRFKNITFKKGEESADYHYLVQLGASSTNCQFLNCVFDNEHATIPDAMIDAGDADNLLVEGCTFRGGNRGVQMIGATPTNCANNNKVKRSVFVKQGLYAVYAQNQKNVEIDSNYMQDIMVNSGYAILMQSVKGSSKVTRNKIYTSHGAAAIGVSGMEGTASAYGIVANNMIVEEDDGVAINIVAPLNVQSAKYVKFVYNSIEMNAPTRVGAASASFGGILLEHCKIQNNAFVTIDSMNFAVSYNPGTATNNIIGNNIYYTNSTTLNRYKTIVCADLAAWQVQVPTDLASQSVNPGYLNGELVDLRTFSQTIKNIATPIAEVTIDMFGTPRHASTPCVGAFEFAILNYDFEIVSVEEPFSEYCGGALPELRVKIHNWGSTNYETSAGQVKLHYNFSNGTTGNTGVVTINQALNANATTDVSTGTILYPTINNVNATRYNLRLWLDNTIDPNNTNDTIDYQVIFNYQIPHMSQQFVDVNYNTPASITFCKKQPDNSLNRIEAWQTSIMGNWSDSSMLYWYKTEDAEEEPFFRGNTLVTDPLFEDTVFYFRQQREVPMIRISEVMMDNSATATGQMTTHPIWMNANTKVAVELTNVGDYPADLKGDTLMITSNESAFRNKVFKFPQSLIIQPGASVVVQFRTGVQTPDSTITLSANINLTQSPVTKNLAVIYYHDGVMRDAVITNNMHNQSQWSNLNPPQEVWGAWPGLQVTAGCAGIRRKEYTLMDHLGDPCQFWESVSDERPLTMGETNPKMIVYVNNGCESERTKVNVNIVNVPSIDLAVELDPIEDGCGLGNETITAYVHNFGIQDCPSATVKFSVGGVLVGTENITNIDAESVKTVTFTNTVNMHQAQDSLFEIKAWVDRNASDFLISNDTASMSVMSSRTPDAPSVDPISTNYATTVTLQPSAPTDYNLIWYNKHMEALDTAASYVTEPIYSEDTFYVKGLVTTLNSVELGTGSSTTANNDKSSPYASYYKYYKTQYIYTAEDLIEAGLIPGEIKSLSFDLADVGVTGDVVFNDYTITMGVTNNSTFTSSTAWESPNVLVFSSDNFAFSSDDEGWLKHTFTTPFEWDGQSNIVVQICRSLQTANRKSVKTRYTTDANSTLSLSDDRGAVCDETRSGSRGSKRPNVKFEVVRYGCEGPITEIPIALVGVPDVDAYLSWDAQVDNMILSTCNPISLPVSIRNMGRNALTTYSITYYVDNTLIGTVPGTANLNLGGQLTVNLPAYTFTPGRHKVKAILTVPNDTFHTNDTIERVFPIRFCGGTYTIGEGMDYENIATALDTLNIVGMDGSLIFNISAGTYLGQAEFGMINGASATHTITFQSASGNADDVILKAYPTNTNNYVVNIDGSEYLTLKNLSIVSDVTAPSQKDASVVVLANCSNVTIDNCNIKVPEGVSKNASAKGVIIKDGVSQLVLSNNHIDSSYYSISSDVSEEGMSDHITISGNTLDGFFKNGISIRNISDVTIMSNTIKSRSSSNNKPLIGVYIADHNGQLSIEKNNIVLSDEYTGGKRGIVLTSIAGTRINRGRVINNMVALSGRGVAGLLSSGILVDSASTYINIYYNSIRLATGDNATTTRSLSIGDRKEDCTNINVRDNILSNFSKGYAYYVKASQSIATSDYNAIYSNAEGQRAHFAYWGGDDYATFAELRTASNKDNNSVGGDEYEPVFVSPEDLHMSIGQYSALADYNADVVDDIDGTVRPQIPSPTIGAHEYNRPIRDVAIVAVIEPRMPENRNDHPNIENKPIRVITKIFNNGTVTERNVTWYAELLMDNGQNLRSATRTIASLAPRQYYTDTTFITTRLGIVDTQSVSIHVTSAGDLNLDNNDTTVNVFLDPAYNLQVTNVDVSVTRNGSCAPENLHAQVFITIKNVGLDTFTTNMPIAYGYNFEGPRGSAINNTLPHNITEVQNLTTFLPPNASREIPLQTLADIYPHGLDSNFTLQVVGWVDYQYDIHNENDTSNMRRINSYYSPQSPVGEDVHIPYGTWDTLWASQRNNFAIEWYRDSTDRMSRFNIKTNYDKSRYWDNTPQYFHDSTYYLSTVSNKGCVSNFSEIHVYVNPRVAYDAAVEQILAPIETGHVYNEKDTVRVRIINHGTQSISNIPVTYLYANARGTQVIQKVTETCTATIAPGETYDFKFDSLLIIETPITAASYSMRAWTDLPNEMTRLNDTMRASYVFNTLTENVSDYASIEVSSEGLDITRVSYNTMHNELHPLGYQYQNFGSYLSPEVQPLHVSRGLVDTIIVGCTNNQNLADITTNARLSIWIDYNRDGKFLVDIPGDDQPSVVAENIINTAITPAQVVKVPVTIPEGSSTGYMRMRVMVVADECTRLLPCGYEQAAEDGTISVVNKISNGQVHDYLLYVDEVAPTIDVALTRVEYPYAHKVDSSTYNIKVAMSNRGSTDITSASIHCRYVGPIGLKDTVYDWTGALTAGSSTIVTLPSYKFGEGTTLFRASVSVAGDIDQSNDTITHEYHRFHKIILPMMDSLESLDMWYAPSGKTEYTKNLWQLGKPNKRLYIRDAYSGEHAWTTDLVNDIKTGKYGNRSELYTPIIDISQIRPDSLIFMLSQVLSNDSYMRLEYLNWQGLWTTVFAPDTVLPSWYDNSSGFSGNNHGGYSAKVFPLSLVVGNLPQYSQFRFVYIAPPSAPNADFGEGCAIDDLKICRAPRPVDVGVIDIPEPVAPKYGETIHPTVVIKNFGTAPVHQVNLAYTTYGSNMAKQGRWNGDMAPGDTAHYTFESSFIIGSDFPDTFEIVAYTLMSSDLYWDNDSTSKKFSLSPLEHDLNVETFVSPLDRVVAGDSLDITVRMRNYGTEPINHLTMTYIFNYGNPVTEEVDLTQYFGEEGLASMEYFNYTFKKRVRASLGYMALTAYGKADQDVYIYNDTISKKIEGITSISDLVATGMIVDKKAFDSVWFAITIDNQGSRAVNDFEVGFWYDNDTSTMIRNIYHAAEPLASLATVSYTFDTPLKHRTQEWSHVCGYVHVVGDNDRSNDTTCNIVEQFVDLKLHRVEVEENKEDDCAVRFVLENIGNLTLTKYSVFSATINGVTIEDTIYDHFVPGRKYHTLFKKRIPKSADREYVGHGEIIQVRDADKTNNQSSIVKVLNYFEGIPIADENSGIVLEQNYPNPFEQTTAIEFVIPEGGEVVFYVVDVMGRVQYQSSNVYDEGRHTINFDANSLASGTYYYGIIYNGERMMRKMIVR